MSNDTFIREVNEEIRQERVRAIWKRYGAILIGVITLIILGTIGYVVWSKLAAERAAADGDRLIAATELASSGDNAGAQAALEQLAADGHGSYREIAQMQLAANQQQAGDLAAALAGFDAVAANRSTPTALRDVAAIRAAYILVDTGSVDDVRERVERLASENEPLRHPALEAIGLALWKANDTAGAKSYFSQLAEDFATPQGLAQRARLMLDLIAANEQQPVSTGAAAPDAATQ
ncbi:tetratricopeptide repeat protein [Aureimonas fodinaquatilis]|uniref:Ancillary SecYEG translocon subunit n=1 Tax=Aureimonas fodinaquatilis TaxID=2565783 RepID=A0A5B0E044_9HYPH|nr:tetratricopeptide repeat protein [Aureimonas fodinaquatilis]KAA0972434.1 tetratricopeptide repeat protein [Aureimonas fodinaquatilis]